MLLAADDGNHAPAQLRLGLVFARGLTVDMPGAKENGGGVGKELAEAVVVVAPDLDQALYWLRRAAAEVTDNPDIAAALAANEQGDDSNGKSEGSGRRAVEAAWNC